MSEFYLEVEPNNIEVSDKEWVQEEIIFTNRRPETYQNVVITMRPAWPVNLKQTKHLLGHLDPGVSKVINLETKIDVAGKTYTLPLTIYIDGKSPQKFNLTISTFEGDSSPPPSPPLPSPWDTRKFRKILNRLAKEHLEQLCEDDQIFDLVFYNSFVGAPLSNADRVKKIIDYCRRREKFPELQKALQDLDEEAKLGLFEMRSS